MSTRLRLADLLGGLSIVADLGFGLPPETAMRSCLIVTGLARRLGATEEETADTFYATFLLHVGCVALAHETAAALGDDLGVNRAVAHTNFTDPRDVFRTLIPEATRGLPPLARARAAVFIVAAAFGDLADLKTPFTHGHSGAVAGLAVAAAGKVRLDSSRPRNSRWPRSCTTSAGWRYRMRSGRSRALCRPPSGSRSERIPTGRSGSSPAPVCSRPWPPSPGCTTSG